mmetsp:Transcript_5337/g.17248  ORF Transcript_5337/g.17248 Transcript_5337/m.17248 type:complete len:451 (-) Transcript_5337:5575-6927(-)
MDRVLEEDQVHGLVEVHGVVVGELAQLGPGELDVGDLHVGRHVLLQEVAPAHVHEGLGRPGLVELVLEHLDHLVVVPRAVLLRDEAVPEHTARLVAPQPHEGVGVRHVLGLHHEHPLNHLGQVAQVEGVVRPRRRGPQLLLDLAVHCEGAVDDGPRQRRELRREDFQEALEDGVEDALHGGGREVRDVEQVEVPHEPRRHHGPAAAGRRVGGDELRLLHLLEQADLLEVVEAAVAVVLDVDHLAKQLDGRLRAVLLRHGHVEVVDEEDEGLARGRPQQVLAQLLELLLEEAQQRARRRLRAEGLGRRHEALARRVEEVLDDDGLAHARVAAHEHVEAGLDVGLQQVLDAGRVDGGHDEAEEGRVALVLELGDDALPQHPRPGVHVHLPVVHGHLGGHARHVDQQLPRKLVKLGQRRVVEVAAQRPHVGEGEVLGQHQVEVVGRHAVLRAH